MEKLSIVNGESCDESSNIEKDFNDIMVYNSFAGILPTVVHAVTYPFPEKAPSHYKDEAVMTVGVNIYLFHSGTDEIRKTIEVNDVLTVYRELPPNFSVRTREVGQLKVLSPLGDYYFDGEVVGGEVKAGDLAKKGAVACLITSLKKTSKNGSSSFAFPR